MSFTPKAVRSKMPTGVATPIRGGTPVPSPVEGVAKASSFTSRL